MLHNLLKILKNLIDYMICIYLILIMAVMPFYNREGYSHIGTDKSYYFNTVSVYMGRVLVPVIIIYLGMRIFSHRGEIWKWLRENLSVTDLFAAGYGVILMISYFCSDYKPDALWGSAGWYMGFWPQMFLVLIYFFVSKLWKPRKWVLYLGLAASLAVFTLGYLNRFGVDPLKMDLGLPGFISTIGNINWYCGYLTSVFFAGGALLWQKSDKKLVTLFPLMLYVTVGFGTLVSQGSDSGIWTLCIIMVAMFCLSAQDSGRMLMFWQEMTLLGCACVITYLVRSKLPPDSLIYDTGVAEFLSTGLIPFVVTLVSLFALTGVAIAKKKGRYPKRVFTILSNAGVVAVAGGIAVFVALIAVNTSRPDSIGFLSKYPIFTFSTEWGSHRGATWLAGWRCFGEQNLWHKLVGVGPDAMSAYLYRDGSPELGEMVKKTFGNSTLTNAHNEWLTVLVNTGLLGCIAFVGMISTAIYRYLKKVGKHNIVCACGMCLLAYTVNNIFSFQQAMSVATIFAVFGMGGAFLRAENAENG